MLIQIEQLILRCLVFSVKCFKVNGYTFKGSNSAILIFDSLLNGSLLLKGKNFLLQEKILSFKSRPHFWKTSSSRSANRKSGKLSPFGNMAEKD